MKLKRIISLIVSMSILLSTVTITTAEEMLEESTSTQAIEQLSNTEIATNISTSSDIDKENQFIRLSIYWAPRASAGVYVDDSCGLDWNATTNGNRMAVKIGDTIDITNSDLVFNDNNEFHSTKFGDRMYYEAYGYNTDHIQCTLGTPDYDGTENKIVYNGEKNIDLRQHISSHTLKVEDYLSNIVEKLSYNTDTNLLNSILEKSNAKTNFDEVINADDFKSGIIRGKDGASEEYILYGGYTMILEGGNYEKVNDTVYAINTYQDAMNYNSTNGDGINWFDINADNGSADSTYGYIDKDVKDSINNKKEYLKNLVSSSSNSTVYHPIQLENYKIGTNTDISDGGYGTICYYWSGEIPTLINNAGGQEGEPIVKIYYDGENFDASSTNPCEAYVQRNFGTHTIWMSERTEKCNEDDVDDYYKLRGYALIPKNNIDTIYTEQGGAEITKEYAQSLENEYNIKVNYIMFYDKIPLTFNNITNRNNTTNLSEIIAGDKKNSIEYTTPDPNDADSTITLLQIKNECLQYQANDDYQLVLLYCKANVGDIPKEKHENNIFNFIYLTEYFNNYDTEELNVQVQEVLDSLNAVFEEDKNSPDIEDTEKYRLESIGLISDNDNSYAEYFDSWDSFLIHVYGDTNNKYILANGYSEAKELLASNGMIYEGSEDENAEMIDSASSSVDKSKLLDANNLPYREINVAYSKGNIPDRQFLEPGTINDKLSYSYIGQKKIMKAIDENELGLAGSTFEYSTLKIPNSKHTYRETTASGNTVTKTCSKKSVIEDGSLVCMSALIDDTKYSNEDDIDFFAIDYYANGEQDHTVRFKDYIRNNRILYERSKGATEEKIGEMEPGMNVVLWRGLDSPTLASYEYDYDEELKEQKQYDAPFWISTSAFGDQIYNNHAYKTASRNIQTASDKIYAIDTEYKQGLTDEQKQDFENVVGVNADSKGIWSQDTRIYTLSGKVYYDERYNYFHQLNTGIAQLGDEPTAADYDVDWYYQHKKCGKGQTNHSTAGSEKVHVTGNLELPVHNIFVECFNGTSETGDWQQGSSWAFKTNLNGKEYTWRNYGSTEDNTDTECHSIDMDVGHSVVSKETKTDTKFTMNNKEYSNAKKYSIYDTEKNIVFYPYVEMLYDIQYWVNNNGDVESINEEKESYRSSENGSVVVERNKPIYVLGGDASVIIPNDFIEVGYNQRIDFVPLEMCAYSYSAQEIQYKNRNGTWESLELASPWN